MRAGALRIPLIFALLIFSTGYAAGTSNAPAICPANTYAGKLVAQYAGTALPMAIGVAMLALLLSIIILGAVYIATKVFPNIHIGRWLQNEYKELVKSAILIVAIFSVLSILSGIAVSLIGAPTGTFQANVTQLTYQSEAYLCTVNTNLQNSIGAMLELELVYGGLSKTQVIWPGVAFPPAISYAIPFVGEFLMDMPVFYSGFGAKPFANDVLGFSGGGSSTFSIASGSLFNDMVTFVEFPMLTFYASQVYLLPLLEEIGFLLLIPLGLIFRAVPLVRGIGGTLIGLGIGLAIVWPSLLVLLNAPLSSYFSSVFSTQIQQVSTSTACNPLGILSTVCETIQNSGSAFLSGIQFLWVPFTTLNSIYTSLNYMLEYNLYLIFQFYFLFVLDLILFYSITDNIARLLGGSIRLSFGRRLKLI